MYQVLIVDDEFLARKLLQDYVSKLPELQLAGTAQNAFEAFSFCKEHHVDIVLLDIHMPDLNGIELARTLKNVPSIIFTTAYSEYALESYEVNAVDYLLKPIALPRFMQAIEKAIARLNGLSTPSDTPQPSQPEPKEATPQPSQTLQTPQPSQPLQTPPYLMVKADYKLYKINYNDIHYIEGQHEYVSFYTKDKRVTALYSLKTLEDMLPRDKFIRVHKSYIVNIDHISEIEQVSLTVAGHKVPIGGSYRESLLERLG
ncbi:MAG: response regulator transcription factor [Bacteroidales bacterium]|nr:response regulator transcription factor [Bacteroidales bacterium]